MTNSSNNKQSYPERYLSIMRKAVNAGGENEIVERIRELEQLTRKESESTFNPFNPMAQDKEPIYLCTVRECVTEIREIMYEPHSRGKWYEELKGILTKNAGILEQYIEKQEDSSYKQTSYQEDASA